MNQIFSKYFGTLDLRDHEIVRFPNGLPGFEEQANYAALSIPGQQPILYLQSITRPDLCLITVPVRVFDPVYQVELHPEDRELVDLPLGSTLQIGIDIACQAIITVDKDREPAANLAAPLIINLSNNIGIQSFQTGGSYCFRHPISVPRLPAC